MSDSSLSLGRLGERLAADHLRQNGYTIIALNYKTRLAEIDIIAKEGGYICFIEVKTRSHAKFGLPQESINPAKRRRLSQAALYFLKKKKLLDAKARFDVVAIDCSQVRKTVTVIKDAFELDSAF